MLIFAFTNRATVKYVFLATISICLNMARKKATMPIMEKTSKTMKKDKSIFAKAAIPTCLGQKNGGEIKPKQPRKKFC